jgi:hypothetical protein
MQDWTDFWTRTFWTAVSAALGSVTTAALLSLDVTVIESMYVAAGTVVVNALTIFARQRAGAT